MPRQPIPSKAPHKHYADAGGYADAYSATLPAPVTLAEFVTAFYNSPLFRLERWVLAVVLGMRSSDAEARAVAAGEAERFAAWTVEARTDEQLVMVDYQGRTRSWFMVEAAEPKRVWFGTAIRAGRGGRVPVAFRALMPFHRLYSRALLRSAVRNLVQGYVPEAPPRKT